MTYTNTQKTGPDFLRRYALLLAATVFCFLLNAQTVTISGRVFDKASKEPVEYATILLKSKLSGTSTDVKGYFSITVEKGDQLRFMKLGYKDKYFTAVETEEVTIYLETEAVKLQKFNITPGFNPANAIMKAAAERRHVNNPENLSSFAYKTYNKFTVGVQGIGDTTFRKKPEDLKSREDTFLYGMNLFLTESVTEKKFKKPGKVSEVVLANRISGLRDMKLILLSQELQSFSFYNDYFKIASKEYLNPMTAGNTKNYIFVLQDTVVKNGDTIFEIEFLPRRNKNFDGLTGVFFIDAKTYALHKAIAQPATIDSGFFVKVEQINEKVDGVLFPSMVKAHFTSENISVGASDTVNDKKYALSPVGYFYSKLSEIQINPDLKNRDFDNVILKYDKDADKQNNPAFSKYRYEPLDQKDSNTYKFIDSLADEIHLSRRLKTALILRDGKIPIKWFSLELDKIIRFNNFEGFRLGAGGETNDKLSDRFLVGGYYAYGIRSQLHNFGGNFKFYWRKSSKTTFTDVFYRKDVSEIGGYKSYFTASVPEIRDIYVSIKDRTTQFGITQGLRLLRYAKAALTAERIVRENPTKFIKVDYLPYDVTMDRLSLDVRFAPGDKLREGINGYTEVESKKPVFYYTLNYTFINEDYDLNHLYFRNFGGMKYSFRLRNAGTSRFIVEAGSTGIIDPYSEMFMARGTVSGTRNLRLASESAFETMRVNEFVSTAFLNIFWKHNFGRLLIRKDKFQPEISILTNFGIGTSYAKFYDVDMPGTKTMEKGYFESGILLDKLYKIKFADKEFSTMGLAIYYRYGAYGLGNAWNNLFFKLSVASPFVK